MDCILRGWMRCGCLSCLVLSDWLDEYVYVCYVYVINCSLVSEDSACTCKEKKYKINNLDRKKEVTTYIYSLSTKSIPSHPVPPHPKNLALTKQARKERKRERKSSSSHPASFPRTS